MNDQPNPEEPDDQRDRREQRIMWIFSGAIVLLIAGAMGANMLFHHPAPAEADTDLSAQARQPSAQ